MTLNKHMRRESTKMLGSILAGARLRQGITQQAVAATLGRKQNYVSLYESGERTLELLELVVICEALGQDHRAVMDQVARMEAPPPLPKPRRVMHCRYCRRDDNLKRSIRFDSAALLDLAQDAARAKGMSLTGYINYLVSRDTSPR